MQAFTNPTEKQEKMFTEKTNSLKYQLEQSDVSTKQNCLYCTRTVSLQVDFKIQVTIDAVDLHKICMQFLSLFTAFKINKFEKRTHLHLAQ